MPADPADTRPLVFISHLSADGEAARLLQDYLDRRFLGALRLFNTSARTTLAPGEHWLDSIVEALRETKILLALLTPNSIRSPWVNFECGAAWLAGARVVPCCGSGVTKGSLPQPYGTLQAVDLADADDLERLMALVGGAVQFAAPPLPVGPLAESIEAAFLSSNSSDLERRTDGARRERMAARRWAYDRSELDPFNWRATYRYVTSFEVLQRNLEELELSFTPHLEAIPFSNERPPTRRLASWTRSSPGSVTLAEPHRRTGSSFAFKVKFDPPLRQGDSAELDLTVEFPMYRVGTRERLAEAQLGSGAELSDYQWSGRSVGQPTDEYIFEVVLPKHLGAVPTDPVVRRFSARHEEEEEFLRTSGSYTVTQEQIDGVEVWLMRLHRFNPPRDMLYRLRWRVPSRATVEQLLSDD